MEELRGFASIFGEKYGVFVWNCVKMLMNYLNFLKMWRNNVDLCGGVKELCGNLWRWGGSVWICGKELCGIV